MFDGNATDTGFSNSDGDVIGSFRDTDGTVYKAGAQIVKAVPFHLTPNCAQRSNWKMMACEESFGQVSVIHVYTLDKENKMVYVFFLQRRYFHIPNKSSKKTFN